MKYKILALFLLVFFFAPIVKAVPPMIKFGPTNYVLAYAASDGGDALNEYILPGQTLDNWTRMVAVRSFGNNHMTAEQAARSMIKELYARNPEAKINVYGGERENEFTIDFYMYTPHMKIIEFNVFRFIERGDMMFSLQFALRIYDNPKLAKKLLQNPAMYAVMTDMAELPKIYHESALR
ncbi:MAG: hypothetical protein LBU87_02580 [Lactobacillales bacterium]|jgi:hypothetical protein|nr:hypothetical protein [Lactobacillales bacterium]